MKKLLTVSLVLSAIALTIAALAGPSSRSTVRGSKPNWANPSKYVSAANTTDYIGFRVYLGWNNSSGAEALAQAVSDPRSHSHRHYFTPPPLPHQLTPTSN